MAPTNTAFWFLLAIMACSISGSLGRDHIVGASTGWRIPKNTTFYEEWARTRSFAIGDRLVFLFTTAVHSVIEVPAADFPNCTLDNVIDMIHNGPLVLELIKPGPHFYYCGIGTHCEMGQKLSINVSTTPSPDPPLLEPAVATPPVPSSPDSKPSDASVIHAFPLIGAMMYLLLVMIA